MTREVIFTELNQYLEPYPGYIKFHNTDSTLTNGFLTDKNKVIICSQIGDLYDFDNLIPFLQSAKENNNFYIFLTASDPPNNLDHFKNHVKFFFIPSFYSWYTKFLKKESIVKNIEKHFLSTNFRNDFARLCLLFYFVRNNLLDKSHFSYIGEERDVTFNQCVEMGADFYLNEFDCSDSKKINITDIKKSIPYILDNDPAQDDWSLSLSKYYNESFLSIVVETYCGNNPPFFTEKIWKPIAMKQPFILMNSKHSLKFLQDLGFKTFSPIIDESYDELDNPHRWDHIFREIKRFSNFSIDTLIEKQQQLQNVLDHNYNHYYSTLPKIYEKEINNIGKEIDIIIKNHIQLLQ